MFSDEELYAMTGGFGDPGSEVDEESQWTTSNGAPGPTLQVANATDLDATRSITSTVREHVYEGGMRYHAFSDGRYAFPNDEIEQNRDDMKHAMCLKLMGDNYFYAPIEDRLRADGAVVLDLGTGTGLWAIEMGEKYPAAKIFGNDLSPIQPEFVPENVTFLVDDVEEEWLDDQGKFDFIHVRHVLHSIRDTKKLLQQAYKNLKPGGYIEIQELEYWAYCDDGSMTDKIQYGWRDFLVLLELGMRAMGSELHAIRGIASRLREAGFEDIKRTTHKCPLGLWPRDTRLRQCGLFLRTAILHGLRGFAQRPLAGGLGWTAPQIETFLVEVRKSVMDSRFHTYYPFHIVYARKPFNWAAHEPHCLVLQ